VVEHKNGEQLTLQIISCDNYMTKPCHQKVAGERERKETNLLDLTPVLLSSTVKADIAQFNFFI